MFDQTAWLLGWLSLLTAAAFALNKLLGQLRNPQSNTRWLLSGITAGLAWFAKHFARLSRPCALYMKGRDKRWSVAFTAYETLYFVMLLLLNLATAGCLLYNAGPILARGEFSRTIMFFLLTVIVVWSVRWCIIYVQRNRTALQRYWPTLNAVQKLQTGVTFNALCTLLIVITIHGMHTMV